MRRICLGLALPLLTLSAVAANAYTLQPNGERTSVPSPTVDYVERVVALSSVDYAVLFDPGFVNVPDAVTSIQPLCAAKGRSAVGIGTEAEVELYTIGSSDEALLAYRVSCR